MSKYQLQIFPNKWRKSSGSGRLFVYFFSHPLLALRDRLWIVGTCISWVPNFLIAGKVQPMGGSSRRLEGGSREKPGYLFLFLSALGGAFSNSPASFQVWLPPTASPCGGRLGVLSLAPRLWEWSWLPAIENVWVVSVSLVWIFSSPIIFVAHSLY